MRDVFQLHIDYIVYEKKIRIVETIKEFKKIKESFYTEPYEAYANCQEEIDKYLKYPDLVKHMKTYRALNLENQKTLINYNKKKRRFNRKT